MAKRKKIKYPLEQADISTPEEVASVFGCTSRNVRYMRSRSRLKYLMLQAGAYVVLRGVTLREVEKAVDLIQEAKCRK